MSTTETEEIPMNHYHNPGQGESVGLTLQDMWRTRPVRIPAKQGSNAWVAGVCEGIAARYQISPLLVRIAFIALTIGLGVGVLTYAVLCLILPRYSVPYTPLEVLFQGHKGKKYRPDRTMGAIAGIITLICAFVGLVPAFPLGLGTIVGMGLAVAVVWLLHQRTPKPVNDCSADAWVEVDGDEGSGDDDAVGLASDIKAPSFTAPTYNAAAGFTVVTPPSWDPLGAAPFAWGLPDPDNPEDADQHVRTPKTSVFAKFMRVFIVLVAVGAVALGGFLVWAYNSDDAVYVDNSTSRDNVALNLDAGKQTLSDATATVQMNEAVVKENQTFDLNLRYSDVLLDLPYGTVGDSYIVKLRCAGGMMFYGNCDENVEHIVRGSDGDQVDGKGRVNGRPIPVVWINIDGVASSVDVIY